MLLTFPVRFPVTFPTKLDVISVALNFPNSSRFTMVDGVFKAVAALAATSALLIFKAVDPPTLTTSGKAAEPPKSLVNLIEPYFVSVAT